MGGWKKGCVFTAVAFFLVSVALIACLVHISSAPTQLRQCQEQLANGTAALTGKLTELEEEKGTLEEQQAGARAEVTELRAELAGANQTLWEMRGRWESCGNLTGVLQSNITALQDEITRLGGREARGGQGETDMLRQQLLEAQQQRDKLKAEVWRLEQQLSQSLKNQSSAGSSLRIPIMTGYLSLLALSLTEILLL